MIKELSFEQFQDMLMTDERYNVIRNKLTSAICKAQSWGLMRCPNVTTQIQLDAIDKSLSRPIPKLGKPLPKEEFWHIGEFGSVWTDVDDMRVAFDPINEAFSVC